MVFLIIRARVKSGLRVLGAEVSNRDSWNMSLDVNPKHTVATVTVFRKLPDVEPAEKRVTPRSVLVIKIKENRTVLSYSVSISILFSRTALHIT